MILFEYYANLLDDTSKRPKYFIIFVEFKLYLPTSIYVDRTLQEAKYCFYKIQLVLPR